MNDLSNPLARQILVGGANIGIPLSWPYPDRHRVCGCPKCPGDCCACADCEVARLRRRVADLEARLEATE